MSIAKKKTVEKLKKSPTRKPSPLKNNDEDEVERVLDVFVTTLP